MTSTHMEQQQHHPEVDAPLAMHYLTSASSTSTHPFGLLVGWFLSCTSSFSFFIALNNKTVVTHGKNTFMVTVVDSIPAATNHHDTFDRAVQFGILTRQQRSSTKGACLGIIHQATKTWFEMILLIGGQLFQVSMFASKTELTICHPVRALLIWRKVLDALPFLGRSHHHGCQFSSLFCLFVLCRTLLAHAFILKAVFFTFFFFTTFFCIFLVFLFCTDFFLGGVLEAAGTTVAGADCFCGVGAVVASVGSRVASTSNNGAGARVAS